MENRPPEPEGLSWFPSSHGPDPEPPDEFDDLREAWDEFKARLGDIVMPIIIGLAYRIAGWRRG